jgi:hypothetical protein
MKQQEYHYTITAKMPAEEAFEKINRVSHWVDEERFYWPVTKVGDTFTVHLRRETCVGNSIA